MSDDIQYIDGTPVRNEQIGFAAAEMIVCGRCGKGNPPNRMDCLYCGRRLELPEAVAFGIRLKYTVPEVWEPGVNVIVTGGSPNADQEAILRAVSIEAEILERAIHSEPPFPLIRTNEEDAGPVRDRLESAGLKAALCSDSSLKADRPPARLKGINFDSAIVEFILFNGDSVSRFSVDEISLVITGTMFETESESTLKRKRAETRLVSEQISSSDHAVIDLYVNGHTEGFRILPHGFDFSCLGERKSLLAVENVRTLKDHFREKFPQAVFDNSYASKMGLLDVVWPRSVTNTSKGFHHVGARIRRSVGQAVSNSDQFTRYSRMRQVML